MLRHKLSNSFRLLPRKLWRIFISYRWEIRVSFGASICTLLLLCALWAISSFLSFIRPAAQAYAGLSFGSASSYCTYWATNHEQIGKPTPGPCGVMLVGVNMSPSDSIPFTADKYEAGNCTYWAALRRGQTGEAIPNTWGDAYMWAYRALADGYMVDHTPIAGAIMQSSAGSLGHVAYVESVEASGVWHISEMNVVGLGQVDYRVMPASAAAVYNFIH